MGAQPMQKASNQEEKITFQPHSQQDLKILEWRSNPIHNEFISKVFFKYQQNKNQNNFLKECKINQNLPLGIKYEKYIGNLTILYGKLNFQESFYVLKSLLNGIEKIYSFFNKAIIDPRFCFITKEGEVKSWINQDYRRNSFQFQSSNTNRTTGSSDNIFLKPQKWIDQFKPSYSPANLIQNILILVSQLCFQQEEYNYFLKKVDNFIADNILKNYNFNRIQKFINKFIYDKKIFAKNNLLQVIQRLYYQNFAQKSTLNHSSISCLQSEGQIQRYSPKISRITENSQLQIQQLKQSIIKKSNNERVYHHRRSANNDFVFLKNSDMFQSTAYTAFGQSNFDYNRMKNGRDCINDSRSQKHSTYYKPFNDKQNLKNHISPQFSFNCMTQTAKTQNQTQVKGRSYNHTPNSSFVSNRSSLKNKSVQFKIPQRNLNVITERKQTQQDEQHDLRMQKGQQGGKKSFKKHPKEQIKFQSDSSIRKMQNQYLNIVQTNKKSNISISNNMMDHNFSFKPKQDLKLFKSNCVLKQNDRVYNFNIQYDEEKSSIKQKSQFNQFFTMKTITKLISSNQNLSNQQQSEGDFPSNDNASSYSGILASMGRSALVIDMPEVQKFGVRTAKKQQTMFLGTGNGFCKTTFNSCDKFIIE